MKELCGYIKSICAYSVYILKLSVFAFTLLGVYALTAYIQAPYAASYFDTVTLAEQLFDCAIGMLAAGVSAAVICDLGHRDNQR